MATEKHLELIKKWDVVNKLIQLENNYQFYKEQWDADVLYRRICELEIGIGKMPTVDAVEVVRCKDCKQWGGVAFGNVCRRWSAPLAGMKNCTKADDFCSYGERRTDHV